MVARAVFYRVSLENHDDVQETRLAADEVHARGACLMEKNPRYAVRSWLLPPGQHVRIVVRVIGLTLNF